jgi:GAF domain-containing protein
MTLRDDRAPVWAIWLLIAYCAIQPFVWTTAREIASEPIVFFPMIVIGAVLVVMAALATRRITWLWRTLAREEHARHAAQREVEQLQTQNAMLETIARSVDVPLALQALASRIARLVPCDRVGLALLTEGGDEFQTYTARVEQDDRRMRPRPEVVFKVDRTIIGRVVRTGEPLIVDDMQPSAPDYLDANVIVNAGLRSALIMPLLFKGRSVGTLNLVSRVPGSFDASQIDALRSIAEILAVAWVAQQLQITVGTYRTMEAMSELTLSVSSEINGALQTIIGHCDLLARTNAEPALQHDLATIVTQAQRIASLLEKMRAAAHERMREVSLSMNQGDMHE